MSDLQIEGDHAHVYIQGQPVSPQEALRIAEAMVDRRNLIDEIDPVHVVELHNAVEVAGVPIPGAQVADAAERIMAAARSVSRSTPWQLVHHAR